MRVVRCRAYKENAALFRQINREARANPQSPYAGKWAGLAGGKVVAVADTLEDLQMEKVMPDRTRGLIFQGDTDYETTDYVSFQSHDLRGRVIAVMLPVRE